MQKLEREGEFRPHMVAMVGGRLVRVDSSGQPVGDRPAESSPCIRRRMSG